VRVKRRHIIYVQGFDPRGLAQYYRMFRTELRKFATLYGVATTISRPVTHSSTAPASWDIETTASDWQTTTRYDFLRWEDLIKQDLDRPIWRIVAHAALIYYQMIFDGTVARFYKAHWRFAGFISYPQFMLALEALVSLCGAFLVAKGLLLIGLPRSVSIIAAAVFFGAMLSGLLKWLESRTYTLYLMADTVFTWEFAHRRRPGWDERIEQFARYLVDAIGKSDADEVIVAGHSSGSFLGVEILSRALELDPDLGRHGPRVLLLTVGGNLPIVGFHAVSDKFRARLRRLAIEPSIDWVDCQSRKDVMNFYPFDPISGHGIDVGAAQRNPKIMIVRFRTIIAPENYVAFRRHLFRVHFQFVMANERPGAYDFFMIVCGPIALSDRVADPAAALDFAKRSAVKIHEWTPAENTAIENTPDSVNARAG
jgi:hypothetical protein